MGSAGALRVRRGPARAAVALVAAAAAWRLANELPRLLWEPGRPNALDLSFFQRGVHRWLAGEPVYGLPGGDLPPASYALLAPLLAPLDFQEARIAWAALSLAGLGALAGLGVRGSGLRDGREQALLALLVVGAYPASAALRVGQPAPWLLPLAVGAVVLAAQRPARAGRDAATAGLLCASLVKPTLTLPFLPVAAAVAGRLRPAVLCVLAYAVVTALAGLAHGQDPVSPVLEWLRLTARYHNAPEGHANLHRALWLAGLGAWATPASLAVLAALSGFLWRRRGADPWLLLGIGALVARLWAHHRLHDDLLAWIALVPLARRARDSRAEAGRARTPELLFVANAALLLAPAGVLAARGPAGLALEGAQAAAWLGTALWLGREAGREPRAPSVAPA